MKKNVLKALFVGVVLSASLGVEASIEQIKATRDKVLKFDGNASVRKLALRLLNDDHMGKHPELNWSEFGSRILEILQQGGEPADVIEKLKVVREGIQENARRAAAAAAATKKPAPAPRPTTAAAAAAAAAPEEQELERQRQEAAINDLAGSILDMIEGLPGEKEIWINALEKILSISDLNRKIEALIDLKLKLEDFIAAQAALRLVHAAAQVRQKQQRLLRAVAVAAADSDSFDIFDSVYQVPNTPPHIPLEEYQQRQQEVAQAVRRLMHAAAQVRQNDNASFKP